MPLVGENIYVGMFRNEKFETLGVLKHFEPRQLFEFKVTQLKSAVAVGHCHNPDLANRSISKMIEKIATR